MVSTFFADTIYDGWGCLVVVAVRSGQVTLGKYAQKLRIHCILVRMELGRAFLASSDDRSPWGTHLSLMPPYKLGLAWST